MKIKAIIVVLVAVISGYIINNPLVFHLCMRTYRFKDYTGCLDNSIKSIGSPLIIFSLWVLLVVIIATFFSKEIFNSWLKLAAWMIPFSIFYIAMTPVNWTGIGLNLFPFYRDDAARVAGIFFSAVSLILIAWKYFSLYRHRHTLKK